MENQIDKNQKWQFNNEYGQISRGIQKKCEKIYKGYALHINEAFIPKKGWIKVDKEFTRDEIQNLCEAGVEGVNVSVYGNYAGDDNFYPLAGKPDFFFKEFQNND